jgi:phosphatidylglycerophosphate synthase
MSRIANALSISRLVIGLVLTPIILAGLSWLVLPLFVIAGVTDVLDGWIARRLRSVSVLGSRLDSIADYIFYGSTPLWVWLMVTPALWQEITLPLLILLAATVVTIIVKVVVRTRRFLHLPSAKVAAAGAFVSGFLLLSGLGAAWMVWVGSAIIIVSELEELAVIAGINKVRP